MYQDEDKLLKFGHTIRFEQKDGSKRDVEVVAVVDSNHLLQYSALCKPKLEQDIGGLPSYKLNRAIAYIETHLSENISLVDIANAIGMSQYYFGRLFRQTTGRSPYQFVIECRVERAKQLLLESSMSITEIALEVGFCSQSHLTQTFKRILGITPKQFLYLEAIAHSLMQN